MLSAYKFSAAQKHRCHQQLMGAVGIFTGNVAAAAQMKKACLTRRAEMMKDMDKKGDLPLSLLATMGKQKVSLGATQKRSPPAFAASRYVPPFAHS